jgi:hypothetical protein
LSKASLKFIKQRERLDILKSGFKICFKVVLANNSENQKKEKRENQEEKKD